MLLVMELKAFDPKKTSALKIWTTFFFIYVGLFHIDGNEVFPWQMLFFT